MTVTAATTDGEPSGLLTDLYQLTMAAGYWQTGIAERETVFHLFFRDNPFGSGFSVACGLDPVVAHLARFGFSAADLEYLDALRGNDGRPLWSPGFLDELGRLRLSCDVDAVPEGTVVFPQEPILRFRGPLIQGQLLETALLTHLNFQTLIATKAARVCFAAEGDPVLEFGLRRAQGVDGGLSASRAAYVGGCAGTSNVVAGRRYGIPIKGTHAHSWVMSFASEPEAFAAYARALPNNCVFLVDTYDTLAGVGHAIASARWLREHGHEVIGIRLDSGDLAALSREARRLLDAAGFPDAAIVASNDLDEHRIARLKTAGAAIDLWGVGTRLATGWDQPALGGVYKLSAWRADDGAWRHAVKLSDDPAKSSNPGVQQVRRFADRSGRPVADVVWDELAGISEPCVAVASDGRRLALPGETAGEDLLVPVMRRGRVVYRSPTLDAIRERARGQIGSLAGGLRRLADPDSYPVGLDLQLYRLRERLIARHQAARQPSPAGVV